MCSGGVFPRVIELGITSPWQLSISAGPTFYLYFKDIKKGLPERFGGWETKSSSLSGLHAEGAFLWLYEETW